MKADHERVDVEILLTPPDGIYERAQVKWGVDFKNTIFTVGNKIHHSREHTLTPDVLQHEIVHVKQQQAYPGGWQAWWERYFEDPIFRLDQETEAYKVQCQVAKDFFKDKNQFARYLVEVAWFLCGDMYGGLLSHSEALELIKP